MVLGKTTSHSNCGGSSLPFSSTIYSSMDLISCGPIKQRRYFDESGKAKQDIDYFHSGEDLHNSPDVP